MGDAVGLLVFGTGLALIIGLLAVLYATGNWSLPAEFVVLVVFMLAHAVATLLRFVALGVQIVRTSS